MVGFHQGLAFALFLDQVILGIWGLVLGFRQRPMGSAYVSALIVDEGLLVLQGAVGLMLFLSGHLLRSRIHFLYGGLLVVLLPVVYFYSNGREDTSRAGLWLGFALLFMAGLIIRAGNTG